VTPAVRGIVIEHLRRQKIGEFPVARVQRAARSSSSRNNPCDHASGRVSRARRLTTSLQHNVAFVELTAVEKDLTGASRRPTVRRNRARTGVIPLTTFGHLFELLLSLRQFLFRVVHRVSSRIKACREDVSDAARNCG